MRSKRVYEFQENGHKFQKMGYNAIIPFVRRDTQVFATWSLNDCLYGQDSKSNKNTKVTAI